MSEEYSTKENFTYRIKTVTWLTYMRVKELKWAGHVVRMFDKRIISYARRMSQGKKAC